MSCVRSSRYAELTSTRGCDTALSWMLRLSLSGTSTEHLRTRSLKPALTLSPLGGAEAILPTSGNLWVTWSGYDWILGHKVFDLPHLTYVAAAVREE
ncbi:unnamed protein product [Gadus morhua 'NCC']